MSIKLICSDIDGTLLQYGKKELEDEIFEQIRELKFADKPFNYLETAEKQTEQNYNKIDGIINNVPPKDSKKPSIKQQLNQAKKEQGEREDKKPPSHKPPEL